jgi:hypothetical protein
MKMNYTDEATFITEEVEIPDEQYRIAQDLYEVFGNYGPVILRNDKKSLSFCVNKAKNRVDREIGTNLYRITIEKI